jgi:hypothetical protein
MTHESEHSQLPWEHCTELCLYIEGSWNLSWLQKTLVLVLRMRF